MVENCEECMSLSCIEEGCEEPRLYLGKYKGYCTQHFIRKYPNTSIYNNYRIKEIHVVDYVKEKYPSYTWVCDKKYDFSPTECGSLRRPDMHCDFGSYVLIIEVDENQHEEHETMCDNKRTCELFQDFGRPIVFIRFNPDGYYGKDGKYVGSCFSYNKDNVANLTKNKTQEWRGRLERLNETISRYTSITPNKEITIEKLFYDQCKREERKGSRTYNRDMDKKKEYMREYAKSYYEKNKNKINERARDKRDKNKEKCSGSINESVLEKEKSNMLVKAKQEDDKKKCVDQKKSTITIKPKKKLSKRAIEMLARVDAKLKELKEERRRREDNVE
jgi:hypothetical protein